MTPLPKQPGALTEPASRVSVQQCGVAGPSTLGVVLLQRLKSLTLAMPLPRDDLDIIFAGYVCSYLLCQLLVPEHW
jgi:hypothetical protein